MEPKSGAIISTLALILRSTLNLLMMISTYNFVLAAHLISRDIQFLCDNCSSAENKCLLYLKIRVSPKIVIRYVNLDTFDVLPHQVKKRRIAQPKAAMLEA